MDLQLIDYGLESKLQEIFDYLSSKAKIAYKNTDLICNETLSKNPFSSIFIKKYLQNDFEISNNSQSFAFNAIKYYKNSFMFYFFFIINFMLFKFVGTRPVVNKNEQLVIIDTYLVVNKVLQEKTFKDNYFTGLDTVLIEEQKQFCYLLIIDGWINPLKMLKVFKILKMQNINYFCEYNLLSFFDLIKLFGFILRYPFKVLKYLNSALTTEKKDVLLRNSIVNELVNVNFDRYARFLQGVKLATLTTPNDVLISWYENQTIHKNLYAGIRHKDGKIKIIGAQLFLYDPIFLSLFPDFNDLVYGLIPDKILVNGGYYMPKTDFLNFNIGPSLRYDKLFTTKIKSYKDRKNIVVLLSYFDDNNKHMLNLIKTLDFDNIVIKPHPVIMIENYFDIIGDKFKIINDNLYDIALDTKCIISCATGAILEMAALGIPVVFIHGKDIFDYNPLKNLGYNKLWYSAISVSEIENLLNLLQNIDNERLMEINKIADEYKNGFFSNPTRQLILSSFFCD